MWNRSVSQEKATLVHGDKASKIGPELGEAGIKPGLVANFPIIGKTTWGVFEEEENP